MFEPLTVAMPRLQMPPPESLLLPEMVQAVMVQEWAPYDSLKMPPPYETAALPEKVQSVMVQVLVPDKTLEMPPPLN